MSFRPLHRFEAGCAAYGFGRGGTFAAAKATRIAYVCERWNPMLAPGCGAFVEHVAGTSPARPPGMEETLRWRQGRT